MTVFGLGDLAFMGAATGGYTPPDAAAAAYIAAVETADGQALEPGVRQAIDAFVVGCKADGIWTAIKASCILAGARTLNGALVPLVGTAPTNFNFVAGDYNRKTGLVGDGSTKYLNSGRSSNADSTNSYHLAVYASAATTSVGNQFPMYIGGGNGIAGTTHIGRLSSNGGLFSRNRNSSSNGNVSSGGDTGLIGAARNSSSNYVFRASLNSTNITGSSQTPPSDSVFIFNSSSGTSPTSNFYSNARIAFYSIGEALDLALLDARVTTLINAFAAAIP